MVKQLPTFRAGHPSQLARPRANLPMDRVRPFMRILLPESAGCECRQYCRCGQMPWMRRYDAGAAGAVPPPPPPPPKPTPPPGLRNQTPGGARVCLSHPARAAVELTNSPAQQTYPLSEWRLAARIVVNSNLAVGLLEEAEAEAEAEEAKDSPPRESVNRRLWHGHRHRHWRRHWHWH